MLSSVRISVLFGYFFITITILTVILCCKISKLDYRFGLILSEINYEKLYLNGLQPKTNTTEKDTASACLIIKDDNPRLIEWIAYHYQVLPLRHLVITSDPSSLTSPKEILDRWRRVIHDLEITEWDEEDYKFPRLTQPLHVHVLRFPALAGVRDRYAVSSSLNRSDCPTSYG